MKAKRLFFTAALAVYTFAALAQDTIRMTWYEDFYYMYNKSINIDATLGEQFIIDWGYDNNIDTITSVGFRKHTSRPYSSTYSKQYTITITTIGDCRILNLYSYSMELAELELINCTELIHLDCENNKLSNLDVSNCMALDRLFCSNNQLSTLNFGKSAKLTYLDCYWNCFSLSECYKMLKHATYISFGKQ